MWEIQFQDAAWLGLKVAACDKNGNVLAHSSLDSHTLAAVLGDRWHEFVEDLPRVLSWFSRDDESEPITYTQLGRIDGKPTRQRITLVKRWAGDAWICYGVVRLDPRPPRALPLLLPQDVD